MLHTKLVAFAAALSLLVQPFSAAAQSAPTEKNIADAYVYLLGRALAIRQEAMDSAAPNFEYNKISYNPLGSADFVNPNLDVAYLEAWIAVDDQTPAILEIPQIEGRYYVAQILDEWGEVIANINERTFPSKPFGTFALVSPNSTADIPEGASKIVLHGKKAKLLGRVEIGDDAEGAVELQKAFKLSSLGQPKLDERVKLPDFDNERLLDSQIFDFADAIATSALDVAPNAAEMQQTARAVAAYVAASPENRAAVDALITTRIIPDFLRYALTEAAPYENNWLVANISGNYGDKYPVRSAVNWIGIWANVPSEVVYFVASSDGAGAPLDGSQSYLLHFPADKLPQSVVDGYWSVILVSVPDYRVVPNPENRFNLNSHSPLVFEPDGSLKIGIGPVPIDGVPEANWLPSPEGKPFSLTFRSYVPNSDVISGRWVPPGLNKL